MNFMENVLAFFRRKPKMELQIKLDTGWMDCEYAPKHWIEKFRNSNYFKIVTDDGWTIKPDYRRYDYLIPCGMTGLWGGWKILLLRGRENIVMFMASDEGLTYRNATHRTRIIVFSNSDNFWTYFMLKYR